MEFTYEIPGYSFFDGEIFDYEVDDYRVRRAIANILCDAFIETKGFKCSEDVRKKVLKGIKEIISDFDLQDQFEKDLRSELKDYFESVAMRSRSRGD